MKTLSYIIIFIVGMLVFYFLILLGIVGKIDISGGVQSEPMLALPTYLSFIGVMMTAVTVVLAALAIGIGIIAAFTFKELKNEAHNTAEITAMAISEKVAKKVAGDALSEVSVRKILLELYAKSEENKDQIMDWGQDPPEEEER